MTRVLDYPEVAGVDLVIHAADYRTLLIRAVVLGRAGREVAPQEVLAEIGRTRARLGNSRGRP